MKVSKLRSFPPLTFFWRSSNVLYSETNFARLNACCLVARYIVFSRVCQLSTSNHE